jgi:hypothetical protein
MGDLMTAIEALDKLMLKFPWQQDKELQEAYAVIKQALDEIAEIREERRQRREELRAFIKTALQANTPGGVYRDIKA